jgi:hypothetical protein
MGFAAVLEDIAADLRAAGVQASVDPRNINPPGVLVRMDAIEPGAGKLCGKATMGFTLILVVPEIGETGAYYTLDELDALVRSVVDVYLTTERRVMGVTVLPGSPTALPCLQMTGTAVYDPTTAAVAQPIKETTS